MKKIIILNFVLALLFTVSCKEDKISEFDFNSDLYSYDYYGIYNMEFGDFIQNIKQDSVKYLYFGDDSVYGVLVFYKNKSIQVYLHGSRKLDMFKSVDLTKVNKLKIKGIDVYNGSGPNDLIITYRFYDELMD